MNPLRLNKLKMMNNEMPTGRGFSSQRAGEHPELSDYSKEIILRKLLNSDSSMLSENLNKYNDALAELLKKYPKT